MTSQDHRRHRDLPDPDDSPGPTGELRRDVVFGTPPPVPREQPHPGRPDAVALDAEAIAEEPVGENTIAEGRVSGTQGPPHASRGQGQGG